MKITNKKLNKENVIQKTRVTLFLDGKVVEDMDSYFFGNTRKRHKYVEDLIRNDLSKKKPDIKKAKDILQERADTVTDNIEKHG